MDKKILITVAVGFIGSNLVDALIADDAHVVDLDKMFKDQIENLDMVSVSPRFTFVKGDVRDMDFRLNVLNECHPSGITREFARMLVFPPCTLQSRR